MFSGAVPSTDRADQEVTSARRRTNVVVLRTATGPPAWCTAHARDHHPPAQRTCAQWVGRPTRRTGGRVRPTAAQRCTCSRAARWHQKPPTSRRNRSRRAGTTTRGSSCARRTPEVAARGFWAELGAVGGAGGQGPCRLCDASRRTVVLSHGTLFAFSVIATLPTLTRPQIPVTTKADCHL